MKLLWTVCCLALRLGLTNCYVEDNGVNHEGARQVKEDIAGFPSSEESPMRADALVLENRRNENADARSLSESSGPQKTLFSKDETIRLESELVTDASVSVVWFQIRQADSQFRSYSGTQDSNSRYYVVLDDLNPGEYFWRVAVRTSVEYVFSPEYSFAIVGTYDERINVMGVELSGDILMQHPLFFRKLPKRRAFSVQSAHREPELFAYRTSCRINNRSNQVPHTTLNSYHSPRDNGSFHGPNTYTNIGINIVSHDGSRTNADIPDNDFSDDGSHTNANNWDDKPPFNDSQADRLPYSIVDKVTHRHRII